MTEQIRQFVWMHPAGNEMIARGYDQVVTISNYIDDITNEYVNIAKEFILDLDFELIPDGLRHTNAIHHYKGYECMYCIQDGELPGLGIYVFFKTEDGAQMCRGKYGRG